MESEKLTALIGNIEKITIFLEGKGPLISDQGVEILARECPDLTMKYGMVDVFVLTRPHDSKPTDNYSMGWAGNGSIRGLWLEDQDGTVIDPWLDERVRKGITGQFLEYLPIVIRKRDHEGPLDIIYSPGNKASLSERYDNLHEEYKSWAESYSPGQNVHPRERYLLDDRGVTILQDHFPWPKAVALLNQTEPPFAPKEVNAQEIFHNTQSSALPKAEPLQPQARNEKAEIINKAIADINTPQKLSPIKATVAAMAGIATGLIIAQFI